MRIRTDHTRGIMGSPGRILCLMVLVLSGVAAGASCLPPIGDDCAVTATCPPEDEADAALSDDGNLTRKSSGHLCSRSEECDSSHCVDGRCCESACDGICERCDISGFQGVCRALEEGSDPDDECSEPGYTGPCGGTCSGNRSCAYPGESTACGERSCAGGVETGNVCNGSGACIVADKPCGHYVCGLTACNSECASNDDCASGAYCDGGECRPVKDNGESCAGAEQCSSGICAEGYCCSSECSAPASCSTGECLCGDAVCAGSACTSWKLDQDRDGYPATSQYDVIGCAGQRPPSLNGRVYYDGNIVQLDCDDDDPDVHPGQAEFFTSPRKNLGGYDYNCDGKETRQHNGGGALLTCSTCNSGGICTVGLAIQNALCSQIPTAYNTLGGATPDCGKLGELLSCRIVNNPCLAPEMVRELVVQGCR